MEQEKVAALIEENIKTIYAYALARVSHKEEAEDLAGDIVLAILQSAYRIRDEQAFFGYIWAIADNTFKKYLRKKVRVSFTELEETQSDNTDFVEGMVEDILVAEKTQLLRRELALLSKEYRECTIAYYFEELPCKAVAEKFHISLEMVKYYLFKTRKLLKEGIGMDREFGEKSYKPGKFEFVTIFDKNYNAEYQNLFTRKLPGNILLSAYYTPMTIRELAIEMGVSSVYMEDEVALLEKYGLIKPLTAGKYQTNLVIFTQDYTKEFYRTVKTECQKQLCEILQTVHEKMERVREIGFVGSHLEENRLLWGLLYMLMHHGYNCFKRINGSIQKVKLYGDATGVIYGVNYEEGAHDEYGSGYFAGFAGIDEHYAAAFGDFGILPKENHFKLQREMLSVKLYEALADRSKASFMILTDTEYAALLELLQDEFFRMSKLYEYLTKQGIELMKVHAPEHMAVAIEAVITHTIYFRTVGLIGGCAVQTKALELPKEEGPVALYVYPITEQNRELPYKEVAEKRVKY